MCVPGVGRDDRPAAQLRQLGPVAPVIQPSSPTTRVTTTFTAERDAVGEDRRDRVLDALAAGGVESALISRCPAVRAGRCVVLDELIRSTTGARRRAAG
jgi:hypothetical protein